MVYRKLSVARARLWSEALASEPGWGSDVRRFSVGAAAMAGCGFGGEAATLPDAGECITPWPLKPFTKYKPSTVGAGPMIAW